MAAQSQMIGRQENLEQEYRKMKKSLLFAWMLAMLAFAVPSAEAKTAGAPAVSDPQIRIQIGRNRHRNWNRWNRFRRMRVTTTTRIVGFGRNRYRETIRTTYYPNGRTITEVIRRERVRW
jgi:hypothetical protein